MTTRSLPLALGLCLATLLSLGAGPGAPAAALDQEMKTIDGKSVTLSKEYAGKVVMVVNVASKCGMTPQYEDLQALYEEYKDQGFVILGMPCNQFGNQEPGTEEEIKAFCQKEYSVTFPMFSKLDVKGEKQSPLYKALTSEQYCPKDPGEVKWNFEKFVIARDGAVAARFRTRVNPRDERVIEVVRAELAKPQKPADESP